MEMLGTKSGSSIRPASALNCLAISSVSQVTSYYDMYHGGKRERSNTLCSPSEGQAIVHSPGVGRQHVSCMPQKIYLNI